MEATHQQLTQSSNILKGESNELGLDISSFSYFSNAKMPILFQIYKFFLVKSYSF